METINYAASAARAAFFGGSSQQEPEEESVSPETKKGTETKSKSNDTDNLPEPETTPEITTSSKSNPPDTEITNSDPGRKELLEPTAYAPAESSTNAGESHDAVTDPSVEKAAEIHPGGLSDTQSNQPGQSALPTPKPTQKQDSTVGLDEAPEDPSAAPAVEAPAAPTAETPALSPVEETKKEAEQAEKQEFPRDPNDHSGEPLGTVKHDVVDTKTTGDESDPTHSSSGEKAKGTGEKYVKSTGMAADGGDFDAAAPGAGWEADRLLDQKGIPHGRDQPNDITADDGNGNGKRKTGLGTKLKEKLHIRGH